MTSDLVEAGLKLASKRELSSKRGTEYLDRTIYHTVYVVDVNGKILIDGAGNKIVRNQALYIASSFLSMQEMETALEIEKQFKELNDRLREDMSKRGSQWKIPKTSMDRIRIQGVTGV